MKVDALHEQVLRLIGEGEKLLSSLSCRHGWTTLDGQPVLEAPTAAATSWATRVRQLLGRSSLQRAYLETFEKKCEDPTRPDEIRCGLGVLQALCADIEQGHLAASNDGPTHSLGEVIERSLRPAFRRGPPTCEKEVQDQIEVILRAIGAAFTREQETAPVGPRAFKPDFVLTDTDLALEVKLTNSKHSASDAQEEISADISAFRTKWKQLLIVIYDCGVIDDPARMREDNTKHFGVSVVIVKH